MAALIQSSPPSLAVDASNTLMTEQQVADRQQRSAKTLRNQRVKGGGIPYLRLGGSVRYRLSDVIAWEQAGLRQSTSDVTGSTSSIRI